MAKLFRFDSGRCISVSGGTSSDPMTFKDITDYFALHPLPKNYGLLRFFGGKTVITGDKTTYSPSVGDKIAVTINGVLYDNIDLSSCTSINMVVNQINSVTDAYYNMTGLVVASNVGGYLVLTAENEDETGNIEISDGSGTINSCVGKLFNSAVRAKASLNSPYDLCEGNAVNWFGQGGAGVPENDVSAGNYTKNSASIKATITGSPVVSTVSKVQTNATYIFAYLPDTSMFAVDDEVQITGTANFNGVRFRILYIANNYFIRGYCPRYFPKNVIETGLSGASVTKHTMLAWNEDVAIKYTVAPYTNISLCDKIIISAKSDGSGSPKIKGIIFRNYQSSPGYFFGAYCNADFALTSSWQTFEVNVRDGYPYAWNSSGDRGLFNSMSKIYIVFEGLSVGENIWIDGLRFVASDRNPVRLIENTFVFKTGLTISGWFKDYGFNVRFDVLDSLPVASSGYIITANAANQGEIIFGNYYGLEKESGVFVFNHFCTEDTGGVSFSKVLFQGITFMGPKDVYGGFSFSSGNSNNVYRNCKWMNMLNFFQSEAGSSFTDCLLEGGRYAFAFPPAGVTINGFTFYGISSFPFYIRSVATAVPVIRGIKYIDESTSNRNFVAGDTYGSVVARNGVRFLNLDLSGCGANLKSAITNYAIHDVRSSPIYYVAFSFNMVVTDERGVGISGAQVKMDDKDGNQLFSVFTDQDGAIQEQSIDVLMHKFDTFPVSGSLGSAVSFDTPLIGWAHYYPYSFTVKAAGYESYKNVLLREGYSRSNEVCRSGAKFVISLKRSSVFIDQEAGL